MLEGSKDFAKAFMMRHHIPTARYETFDGEHLAEGLAFLETLQPPYVLKADGLCAGKGVLIVPTLDEARHELRDMLGGRFGNASARVVIEEYLSGIECSVFVLTDGEHYQLLPEHGWHGQRLACTFCHERVDAEGGRAHCPPHR